MLSPLLPEIMNGLTRMSAQEASLACILCFDIFKWAVDKLLGWWNQYEPPVWFQSTCRYICLALLHDGAHLVGASLVPGASDHLEEPDSVDGRRCA
jgi:hypothetical protein